MCRWVTWLVLAGCGSSAWVPDAGPDAAVSPDPWPEPVVSACGGALALPALPAIAQHSPLALAVADLTGDGAQDVAVLEGPPFGGGSGAVVTYASDGAGGLAVVGRVAVAAGGALATGHLDGDGHVDVLVVSGMYGAPAALAVLRGAGDGTFAAPTTYALPPGAEGVTLADLDGDARLDAIVASTSTGPSLLRGNGDGTLQARVDLPGPGATHVVAAQLDADPALDLALASRDTSVVRVLSGNGDLTFDAPVDVPVGYPVEGVAAGDLDEDGDLDLIAAHARSGVPTGDARLLLNDGAGAFAAGATSIPLPVGAAAVLDVDGDAHLDIVHTWGVAHGAGDGSFPRVTQLGGWASGITSVAAGRFDGDARADFLVARAGDGLLSLVRGAAPPVAPGELWSQQGGTPAGVAIADFDGDTRPDVAILNHFLNPALEPGRVAVFLATAGGFAAPQAYDVGYAATTLLVSDLDQDGRPDLAASHGPSGFGPGVTVLMNTGGGFARTDHADQDPVWSVVAGDFDQDGRLDLLRATGSGLVLMRGGGDGTFAAATRSAIAAQDAVAGDLDGDGDLDLVTLTQDVQVALNTRAAVFVAGATLASATGPSRAALADLDGDGDLDVVVRSASALRTFRNAGDATFAELPAIEVAALEEVGFLEDGTSVQLADLDGDGRKDIVTTQRSRLAVLRGNGDATFQPPLLFPAAGAFARAGHLDADLHLDVVSAGVGGQLRILPNTCAP